MYRLPDTTANCDFPDDFETTEEGLLALGGNLAPQTLINAYAKGIFPWFGEKDPILWWHPDPRLVLFPQKIQVSRSMRQFIKKISQDDSWQIYGNRDFAAIMRQCSASKRAGQEGTWITESMLSAYTQLHALGYAHCVGVWHHTKLVGGLYGVAMGKVFFGESMFSASPNASKLALIALTQFLIAQQVTLIDCQQDTPHLRSLGAELVSRAEFLQKLQEAQTQTQKPLVFPSEYDLKRFL